MALSERVKLFSGHSTEFSFPPGFSNQPSHIKKGNYVLLRAVIMFETRIRKESHVKKDVMVRYRFGGD